MIEDITLADVTANLADIVFGVKPSSESYTVFVDLPTGERGAVTVILSNLHTPTKPTDHIRATETVVQKEELEIVLNSLKRWFNK